MNFSKGIIINMNKQLQESIPKPEKNKVRKVGPYLILKQIGKGAYSTVFQGKMQFQKKKLAIKQISLSNIKNKDLQRIQLEIKILSLIKHENIVELIDFKKSSRHLYLIFEHCEHTDLDKHIKKYYNGKMPEQNVQKIFIQIKKAFQVLRQNKIVHRDLKLANLLVTQDFKIKIGDFGFANLLEDNKLFKSCVGTPLTMAPEILNKMDYNQKCDIWSLGIILYQMLTGKNPFVTPQNMTFRALRDGINNKNVQFDQSVKLSDSVKDLIKKMIVKDSEKRLSFENFFRHEWLKEQQNINVTISLRNTILQKELNHQFGNKKTPVNDIVEIKLFLDKILLIKVFNHFKNYFQNKLYANINISKKLITLLIDEQNIIAKKLIFLGLIMILHNIERIQNQENTVFINQIKIKFFNYNAVKIIKQRQDSEFSKGLAIIVNKNKQNIRKVLNKLKDDPVCKKLIQNDSYLVLEQLFKCTIAYIELPKFNKELVTNILKIKDYEKTYKLELTSSYLSRSILNVLNKWVTWQQLSSIETILNDEKVWSIFKKKQKLFQLENKNVDLDHNKNMLEKLYENIRELI